MFPECEVVVDINCNAEFFALQCREDFVVKAHGEGCDACRLEFPQPTLMGVVSRNRPAMDSVCDEVLTLILGKLPIPDVVRAPAVCHRWRERMDAETAKFGQGRGYCPLAFQRFDEQHTCLGFDSATWKWESLPSLSNVPRAIHLVPVAGSGSDGLLAFKVSQQYSEYIVGSPYSQKWTTLPKSADSWGDAAMFMTTTQRDTFRVVAVRDGDTHIYKSESDKWMKVEWTPQSVQVAQVVSCIRSKACAAVNNCLYTTDGNLLIAFDMCTEQWVIDRIRIPITKYVMQVVGCAGSLFFVTEEKDSGRIRIWDRGVHLQEFSLTAEMPQEIQSYLRPAVANARSRAIPKLRSVGHGQMLFFWRRNSLIVVSYDLRTRGWRKLPEIVKPDIVTAGEPPQVIVDAGFFEPKYRIRTRATA